MTGFKIEQGIGGWTPDGTAPLAIALEPRFMFDAAGVATGAEVAEQAAADHAAQDASHDDSGTDGTTEPAAVDSSSSGNASSTEVVFIDAAVEDADQLIAGLPEGTDYVLLSSDSDGVQQIADYLQGRDNITALHIISHGGEGEVTLGNVALNDGNLSSYTALLSAIGQSLTETGDILLYGCNIGSGDDGSAFLSSLAEATGADVAASDDTSGAASLGGDWDLEKSAGTVETASVLAGAALDGWEHTLADVVISNTPATASYSSLGGFDIGQSFTATKTGVLSSIAVASDGGYLGNWTLTIYSGSDTSGTELHSQTGTAFSDTVNGDHTYTLSTITISATVNLTSGNVYTFVFTPAASLDLAYVDNAYANGTLVSATYGGAVSAYDMIFEVTQGDGSTDPTIDSATYNASTGTLVVTGTNYSASGGSDVDASKLTFTGEGGATYTLTDTADVEIDSATQFTVTLSATDKAAVNQMLNTNGTSSTGGTTYDLDGAAGFIANAATIADTGANGITVSGVSDPTISSATYNYNTNTLTVTGANFVHKSGATNDVDVSTLTITGEGGATYTLSSSSDVEITDGTTFSVTLTGADIQNVEALLNKDGTTSATASTTFNLAAADNWMAGATAANDIADATNTVTVSNYAVPAITSATFNYATGVLTVTGTNFVSNSGATNDVDLSLLTITGENGETYTLTTATDVEITSATEFSVTLTGADLLAVKGLLNKDGTTSATAGTTFNLAAADNWMAGSPAGNDVSDATSGITVSSYAAPTITSATYDYGTNTLVVTGTNFVSNSGAANDIDVSTLTITGEGGATYTLSSSTDVEVDSGTQFTVTLSGADIQNVEALLNADGTTSATTSTTYNLAAADNWLTQAPTSPTPPATASR